MPSSARSMAKLEKIEVSVDSPLSRNSVERSRRSAAGRLSSLADSTARSIRAISADIPSRPSRRWRRAPSRPGAVVTSNPWRASVPRTNCSRALSPGSAAPAIKSSMRRSMSSSRLRRAGELRDLALGRPGLFRERRAKEQQIQNRLVVAGHHSRTDGGVAAGDPVGPDRFGIRCRRELPGNEVVRGARRESPALRCRE